MSGNGPTDTVYGQLDEACKQQIISDLESECYDVSFGADGYTVSLTFANGNSALKISK